MLQHKPGTHRKNRITVTLVMQHIILTSSVMIMLYVAGIGPWAEYIVNWQHS